MTGKIPLLVLTLQTDEHLALLREHYDVTYAIDPTSRAAAVAAKGDVFRAVLTGAMDHRLQHWHHGITAF